MHICNYCKRVLKGDYETCPGCGGSSFSNKAFLGETIIKNPPKDGYKINKKNYKKAIKNAWLVILLGIVVWIILAVLFFPFIFTPSIFGICIIIGGIIYKNNNKKNIRRVEKLSKKGLLVKGLKYEVVNTGTMVMGKYYKCIKINYKNSCGVEIPPYSETKYDIDIKKYKTVDLLIDPDDYSNYFIDYEIY